MSKNPPDWWARGIGGLGLLVAVGGLVLSFFNYRWQKAVYEKSQEERVFVQLSAEYNLSTVLRSITTKETPQGQLAVEVVNLGLQPMYIKSVTGEIGGHKAEFYEHDPMKSDPMRKVEPGEGADYKINWPVASLQDIGTDGGKGSIEVETTKKSFSQPVRVNRVNVVSDVVTLLKIVPGIIAPASKQSARHPPTQK